MREGPNRKIRSVFIRENLCPIEIMDIGTRIEWMTRIKKDNLCAVKMDTDDLVILKFYF